MKIIPSIDIVQKFNLNIKLKVKKKKTINKKYFHYN
jgi:hypothetical protein